MNLGTIGAILGAIASLIAILAYFDNGIQKNKARLRAEKGRIISLAEVAEIQAKRIEALEKYVSFLSKEESKSFNQNNPLIDMEKKAMEEYRKHNTDLT